MTGPQHKAQLTEASREIFAAKGLGAASVEETAAAARISKPAVYERFGTKERFYQAVVDQEVKTLEAAIREALSLGCPRHRIEQAVLALLTYVEGNPEGFFIISRDPDVTGGYETLSNNAIESTTSILVEAFRRVGFDPAISVLCGNCMVGTVSQTARWWVERRSPDKEMMAAHIVNLCWNGLVSMEGSSTLHGSVGISAVAEGAKFGAGAAADSMQMTENS